MYYQNLEPSTIEAPNYKPIDKAYNILFQFFIIYLFVVPIIINCIAVLVSVGIIMVIKETAEQKTIGIMCLLFSIFFIECLFFVPCFLACVLIISL